MPIRFLDVRLEEPQQLVERARIGGEDVGGIGVARLVGLVDRVARQLGGRGVALDQRGQMVLGLVDVGRVGLQLRRLADFLRRAVRGAAQLHGALGDGVDMVVDLLAEVSSISWMAMKCGPLTFQCACLVMSARSIAVRQPCVEDFDRLLLGVRLEVVLGGNGVHGKLLDVRCGRGEKRCAERDYAQNA